MRKLDLKSFLAGIIIAAILIPTVAYGATAIKSVQATFAGLKKIVVNGVSSIPAQNKLPLIYNNNVCIPLSYVSDYMFKNTAWDIKTGTITISGIKVKKADQDAIFAALELNIKHGNDMDLEGYLSDLSSKLDKAMVASTKSLMEYLFANFKLEFKITKIDLIQYDGLNCEVRMVMETRKLEGDKEFTDNRCTSIQMLVKENGVWKLSSSVIEKTEALQ